MSKLHQLMKSMRYGWNLKEKCGKSWIKLIIYEFWEIFKQNMSSYIIMCIRLINALNHVCTWSNLHIPSQIIQQNFCMPVWLANIFSLNFIICLIQWHIALFDNTLSRKTPKQKKRTETVGTFLKRQSCLWKGSIHEVARRMTHELKRRTRGRREYAFSHPLLAQWSSAVATKQLFASVSQNPTSCLNE